MTVAKRYWLKGEYIHTIDQKGRTYLPARFREVLGQNVVIGLGLSKDHLVIYPEDRYDEIADNIEKLYDEANEEIVRLRDHIFNYSYDVETDKSGRFTVPTNLRDLFEVTDEVIIIGDGDKAKIWTKTEYDKRRGARGDADVQALASKYGIFKHAATTDDAV
jgi:MraZ protein